MTAEPLVIVGALSAGAAIVAAVLASVSTLVGRRDNAARAQLQAAVTESQNALITRLQVEQAQGDARLDRALLRIEHLEASDDRKDRRINQVVEWGRWSTESPPRTVPPWED